jgi:acyl dehydratase
MELSSHFVGLRSKPYAVEVSARRAMAYAAGIGDTNPRYLDDTRPGGPIAPPMLAIALTWPLASQFSEFWDVGDFPLEVLAQQVHYSESLVWERPLRHDETLKITGEIVAIMPHRAGTHLVIRFEATGKDGGLVFTEHIGGMLRGVVCAGAGCGGDNVPKPHRPPRVEEPQWTKTLQVSAADPWVYDACADVHFPIHTSAAFAHLVGLPGPIYQGTATLARAVSTIIDAEAGGEAERLLEVSGLFTGMVLPDTNLAVEVMAIKESTKERTLFFRVLNQEGRRAIRDGCVRLAPAVTKG